MPVTEQRKIVRFGKTSFGVILPIGWLRYFEIKPGDAVQVTANGEVTVQPLKRRYGAKKKA